MIILPTDSHATFTIVWLVFRWVTALALKYSQNSAGEKAVSFDSNFDYTDRCDHKSFMALLLALLEMV